MKLKKTDLFYCLLISLILFSCTTAKVQNLTNKGKDIRKIDKVKIIALNEKIEHNGEKIADFFIRENPLNLRSHNIDWEMVKNKLNNLAISSGANLVEINSIGYGIKHHIFYVDGNLFYKDDLEKLHTTTENEPCSIVVFRDGLESMLGSAFNIDIKIEDREFKNINKDNFAKKEFDTCLRNVDLVINDKNIHNVELVGKSKYYKVSKLTSGNSVTGGVQIGIGGVFLVEIEDKELGRLMMLQN